MTTTTNKPRYVTAGDLDIYVEQVGEGPDVLLIGGLGDTVESWQFQLDGLAGHYRMTAFDSRGAGRTAMPKTPATVEAMADDAAAVLRALDIASAHVAGFSGGSIIAQELALRHPELVRSLVLQSTWPAIDAYLLRFAELVRWLVEAAPANGPSSSGSSRSSTRRARTTTWRTTRGQTAASSCPTTASPMTAALASIRTTSWATSSS